MSIPPLRSRVNVCDIASHAKAIGIAMGRQPKNNDANSTAPPGIGSRPTAGTTRQRARKNACRWRLLHALGIQPGVRHLNEGRAAFAILERARTFMNETGQPFDVAMRGFARAWRV
jgi:hypothetical protein